MRSLLFHCEKFQINIIDGTGSDMDGICLYKNALCAFITVEMGDNKRDLASMASYISNYYNKLLANTGAPIERIALIPFVHLSECIEKSPIAKSAIKELADLLKKKKHEVVVGPFGGSKSVIASMITFHHKYDFALKHTQMSLKYDLRKLESELATVKSNILIINNKIDKLITKQ